jgi:hypothetical protein
MLEYLYGKMFSSKIAIFEPNLFPYKYPNILKPSHSSYLTAYENGTECFETSTYKTQAPGNYPEESIQHSEHSESLKSNIYLAEKHFKMSQ